MPDYGRAGYWNERYAAAALEGLPSFDWYHTYDTLKPYLEPFLSRADDFEVFVPGCGSSTLSARLYEDGYMNVSNVDVSPVVVSQLRQRFAVFAEMDCTYGGGAACLALPVRRRQCFWSRG
jgi:SAM-dependent methyltransferase